MTLITSIREYPLYRRGLQVGLYFGFAAGAAFATLIALVALWSA